ncbi:MAG: methylated-DNA--[protein]-cysteine S-methyltransferase [Chloroflexota bacterium]
MIDQPTHQNLPVILAMPIDAPWGPVHLAATDRGVVAVELMATQGGFSEGIERRFGRLPRWVEEAAVSDPSTAAAVHLRAAGKGLSRALRGDDIDLAGLPVDLDDRPAWDRSVLGAVRAIPRGETRSYGDIARAIGRPGAARAVGGAVGRNPIAFIIPCHRVIAGDGTLGGYGGGWWGDRDRLLELKTELLAAEGLALRRTVSRGRRAR